MLAGIFRFADWLGVVVMVVVALTAHYHYCQWETYDEAAEMDAKGNESVILSTTLHNNRRTSDWYVIRAKNGASTDEATLYGMGLPLVLVGFACFIKSVTNPAVLQKSVPATLVSVLVFFPFLNWHIFPMVAYFVGPA